MRLFTHQPLARLVDLQREGVIYGAREKGMFAKDMPHAYDFMVAEMAKRIGSAGGVRFRPSTTMAMDGLGAWVETG